MMYALIAIPKPIARPLTYAVPANMEDQIRAGHRVAVPFHKQMSIGYVIDILDEAPAGLDLKKIRQIDEILDKEPIFSKAMLKLLSWMASYYCAPIGEVFRLALPPRLGELKGPKLSRPSTPHEMLFPVEKHIKFKLSDDQQKALNLILEGLQKPKPILLHGITGSGKTEVYLGALEEVKNKGGQAILLIPEIALTPQLLQRLNSRFGRSVAVYHSGLTPAQRLDQWRKMRGNEVFAAVGTRSALFAPFENLRLIIVDEEHDGSYKQDEGVFYSARDSAIMRAKLEGALVVLGSATPSMESFSNAKNGKYDYCNLPKRAGKADLPSVEIVDMRLEPPQRGKLVSHVMLGAIEKTLGEHKQILLFLNRRGFANFILCKSCGDVLKCPNCNISLTYHKSGPSHGRQQRLLCHYCNYSIQCPRTCQKCGGLDLNPVGGGTQKLEQELKDIFPKASIVRLDRDTSSKALLRRTFLTKMQNGEIDILVGTQMIAKGHDFPNVTLVGVVDADVALHLPDFRSFERTFQLITQVAGRAGRGEAAGKVIIQTYQPDHPAFLHAKDHNYTAFFAEEESHRRALKYPPFIRIANIRISGNLENTTVKTAYEIQKNLKHTVRIADMMNSIAILGPAPAPLPKVRGKFRWQILIKAASARHMSSFLNNAVSVINNTASGNCRAAIDVDPINLL